MIDFKKTDSIKIISVFSVTFSIFILIGFVTVSDLSPVSDNVLFSKSFGAPLLSFISVAEMAQSYSMIETANIGFVIQKSLVDIDEIPESGDEITLNTINYCQFHSADFIDVGSCLICKLKDMSDQTIAVGQVDLPEGYTPSTTLFIPIDPTEPGANNAVNAGGVEIAFETIVLDFAGLQAGTLLDDQYAVFGIHFSGMDHNDQPIKPAIFDTDATNTPDADLEVGVGNIMMIDEFNIDADNDGILDQPADDSAHGGKIVITFDPPRFVSDVLWIDGDRGAFGNILGQATTFNDINGVAGSVITQADIVSIGDGSQQILVIMNSEKTHRLEFVYEDSGGGTQITLGCPA